jgi:hypothetical protein
MRAEVGGRPLTADGLPRTGATRDPGVYAADAQRIVTGKSPAALRAFHLQR